MGYVKYGNAKFLLQAFNFKAHFFAKVSVQVGQRFVKQHNGRVSYESTSQSNALLLTAGKFGRQTFIQAFHTNDVNHTHNQFVDFSFGAFFHFQRISDVFKNSHVGPNSIVLEYDTQAATFRRNVFAGSAVGNNGVINADFAFIGNFVACNHTNENGFTATGRTEQGKAFASDDVQAQVLVNLVFSVTFGYAFNPDNIFHK